MQLVKQVSLTKDIAVCVQVDSKERIAGKLGILTYFVCLFEHKNQNISPCSSLNPKESVFNEAILCKSYLGLDTKFPKNG